MLQLEPGKFYVSKVGEVWCCYVDRGDDPPSRRNWCVQIETARAAPFYSDGRRDLNGESWDTLVSELPLSTEKI